MDPLAHETRLREERLKDGLCPVCSNRLFKVSHNTSFSKILGRNRLSLGSGSLSGGGGGGNQPPNRLVPITIAGKAERGQCLLCINSGSPAKMGERIGGDPAPAVRAVPVISETVAVLGHWKSHSGEKNGGWASVSAPNIHPTTLDNVAARFRAEMPVRDRKYHLTNYKSVFLGSDAVDFLVKFGICSTREESVEVGQQMLVKLGIFEHVHRDHNFRDEKLFYQFVERGGEQTPSTGTEGCDDPIPTFGAKKPPPPGEKKHPSSTHLAVKLGSEAPLAAVGVAAARDYSDEVESDDDSDFAPLLDMKMSEINLDDTPALIVGQTEWDEDDRKPAAKLTDTSSAAGAQKSFDESAARIQRLREQAAAAQQGMGKVNFGGNNDGGVRDGVKLKCPPGVSPDVFYNLPPAMQREVINDKKKSSLPGNNSLPPKSDSYSARSSEQSVNFEKSYGDMDPETLASLPEDVRREVLDQARIESNRKVNSGERKRRNNEFSMFTKSTVRLLGDHGIDLDDLASFPEDVQNEIIEDTKKKKDTVGAVAAAADGGNANGNIITSSGFDPEMLASLPEDVREEVLQQERLEQAARNDSSSGGGTSGDQYSRPRSVGAHSVNVPAGYDPETFAALPEEVRQELMDEATRESRRGRPGARSAPIHAEGYDYDDILDALVVPAQSMSNSSPSVPTSSCTYSGEYNAMGKRHGDGELKWANGDKYVGKFKDGFIEGRGTINFHDGTEYAGQWSKNRFHGEGTRRFNNGNVYTGNYIEGKRQGQGRCYFANGDMYVGDWKNDTIHGFGRYYYNNGHSFEGMFRSGKRNGRGKYQLSDGRVEIYRYVNDCRVGDGVRWSANRKKAWRMVDGKVRNRVNMDEAAGIANRCGPVVEES